MVRAVSGKATSGRGVVAMPLGVLREEELEFLDQAIEISAKARMEDGLTPFGAVVTQGGLVVGVGRSSVMLLRDATAHAEVMALRDAGRRLDNHCVERGVMYSSSEPCPLCLAACYWAGIERLVYAAGSDDAERAGFEDKEFYRQLALPNEQRTRLVEVQAPADRQSRIAAAAVLEAWSSSRGRSSD
jgi:tRNA(Arg) A34 adenosine deaminase TadA